MKNTEHTPHTTHDLHGADGIVDARIDHDRADRCGFPEVIYAAGKTPEQVARIALDLCAVNPLVLATRALPEHHAAVEAALADAFTDTPFTPEVTFDPLARIITVRTGDPALPPLPAPVGNLVVACAGTSDLPVAEEAACCAEAFGAHVERLYDIGIAGVHRTLAHLDELRAARVIIAVAGMEGALPTLIAGLVDVPVVAVPTSVGYGVHLNGIAPLLTMLNSCSGGIGVVNIDNGYGAAVLASRINNPKWIA